MIGMKKIWVSLVAVVLTVVLPADARQYVVLDSLDRSPVAGATVIDNAGIIKGLSDAEGRIVVGESELPVSIRCIGYEPVVTDDTADTIFLTTTAYQLNVIVVSSGERPIKRVLCFAREYSSSTSGSDTMQYYCEYMAEAYIAQGKVKGYRRADARPTPKAYKRYARISVNGVDSIYKPTPDDDLTALSWFEFMAFLPDKEIEVPEPVLAGARCDTVAGKYGPRRLYRKRNGLFTVSTDVLSDHKNRKWSPMLFKLIGMTIDITEASWNMSFVDNDANSFGIDEFISGTYNIHLIGRGKWIKKIFDSKEPVEMDSYLEVYPMETTNLTVGEYKEMRDDRSRIPFQYPSGIQAMTPSVDNLVRRLDAR